MNYALIRRVLEARIQQQSIDFAESKDEERSADTVAQQAVEAAADARFGGSRRSQDAEVVASVLTAVGSALALAGNVGECKVASLIGSATGATSGLVNVVAGPDGAFAEAAVAEDIAKADASVARAVRKAREADRDQTIDRLREILLRRHA